MWLGARITPTHPPQLSAGTLLTQPKVISSFSLIDHRGQTLGLEQLRGQWTFAFFGYTHCPDVCPNTLMILDAVAKNLAKHEDIMEDTRFLFVSVDPSRDDIERLGEYVTYFNPTFIGATGKAHQLDKLTRQLGILYAKAEGPSQSGDDYLIDHSASILLFDAKGRLAAVFSQFPHDADAISRDYLEVRKYFGA